MQCQRRTLFAPNPLYSSKFNSQLKHAGRVENKYDFINNYPIICHLQRLSASST